MSRRATVDTARLVDVLKTEAGLLVATARDAAPDAQVPACPGLTLGETVRHLGGMYRAAMSWIVTGQRPAQFPRRPDAGQSTVEFLEEGLAALLAELEAHAPADVCASWWPEDETFGFWRRRIAHETLVHRVDVQGAARVEADPIDDDIALDGIDEVLTLWFGRRLETLGLSGDRHASVVVRAGGRRWLATASPDGTTATAIAPDEPDPRLPGDAEGPAGAAVTSDPTRMFLWLWGRRPLYGGAVTVEGDDDAVAQLWALLRLATR